jgi:hypothetical protein
MIEKAFPSIAFDSIGQITSLDEGMDLRDYFAAKAMQSLINEKYWHNPKGGIDEINIADDSYRMANAMMIVRKKYDI